MVRRKLYLYTCICLVLLSVFTSGCSLLNPPKITFSDISIIRDPYISGWAYAMGTLKNSGGHANYLEVAIKLKNDSGTILSTGWTNFLNIGKGESREFEIVIMNYKPSWTKYELVWSTSAFSVAQ